MADDCGKNIVVARDCLRLILEAQRLTVRVPHDETIRVTSADEGGGKRR
jgi:hypothetical protein